jgi:hypothetical protein
LTTPFTFSVWVARVAVVSGLAAFGFVPREYSPKLLMPSPSLSAFGLLMPLATAHAA